MTNKSKKLIKRYERNFQDAETFSFSEMKELRSVFALYCCEPEPLYVHGKFLYV
jgi:hypothetical protein